MPGAIQSKSNLSGASFLPKPFIAIHTRYHATDPYSSIPVGYCISPPFPKEHGLEKISCRKIISEMPDYPYVRDMHTFEFAQYWQVDNITIGKLVHEERMTKIQNCSHNWSPMLFLSMVSQKQASAFPWMREKACQIITREHKIKSDSMAYALPIEVRDKWFKFGCFYFDLNYFYHQNIDDTKKKVPVMNISTALQELQRSRNFTCFENFYWVTTPEDFVSGKLDEVVNVSDPTLFYPFCKNVNSLGNSLGTLYNVAGCAIEARANFGIVKKNYLNLLPGKFEGDPSAFFDTIPDHVVSNEIGNVNIVKGNAKACSSCRSYCWQFESAPWRSTKNIQFMVNTSYAIAANYMRSIKNFSSDVNHFSFIPDVVIHYRCGDNLNMPPSVGMGLIPFSFYPKVISNQTKSIQILSDDPERKPQNKHECTTILNRLKDYIKEKFPLSTVLELRGGDPLLSFSFIALANTTICSPSTFCFFASIGNPNTVNYPLTKLIAANNLSIGPTYNFIKNLSLVPKIGRHELEFVLNDLLL